MVDSRDEWEGRLPVVVYIAGYGRSGSTVLDMVLGGGTRGLGEVVQVFEAWNEDQRCSCQQPYHDCELWAPVMARVQSYASADQLRHAAVVTRRVERWRPNGRGIASTADKASYRLVWRTLFGVMREVAASPLFVDSSKSDRFTANRALSLARIAGLDVRVIHLVRDPRAVAWSVMRGSNRRLEAGQPATVRGGAGRALLGWSAANWNASAAARRLPSVRVRYEDFVDDPVAEVQRVEAGLGVSLTDVVERLRAGEPLSAGHGVAGNRLRRNGADGVRRDGEWLEKLPTSVRVLAAATWPLARRHGYRLV